MLKFLKLIIGFLLLPVCIGSTLALWRTLQAFHNADRIWIPMVTGAICWVVIYFLLPRPMWLYVLGHELTHAVATWCFGGRVGRIKVSSEGGHAMLSKTNFVIALAPYFFPFYVVIVLLLFLLLRLALPWDRLELWFLLMLGIAYAFHITLTGHVLKTRQSDITQHGYIFSAAIIFIGNVLVLLLGIPLLTSNPSVPTAFAWCWESTVQVVQSLHSWIG